VPAQVAWWVPVLNRIGLPARRGDPEDSLRALRQRAARRAGLTADADPEFLADLLVLHRCIQASPELAALGRYGLRDEMLRVLENRLRVRACLAAHPEIADLPVTAPVVIVGLPRSGTTLLHGLLASVPGHRAPLLWELLHAGPADADPAARQRRARRLATLAHRAGPGLRSLHPLAATWPEECTFALPHSLHPVNRADVPGYREWYAARDPAPDYRYLRQQLQVLQWRQPPRRWVLKSPYHLWALDTLLDVFPGVTFVWPHRDPAEVLASWCSLVEVSRRLHGRGADPRQIGADWLALWPQAMSRAMAVRAAAPARFIDVSYPDLAADPVAAAQQVLARLGAAPDTATRPRLAAWLDQGAPAGNGRHRHGLDRYGLTADGVRAAFAGYLAGRPA
jgi:hypothetical protein